jgi:hypothetical protein
MPQAKNAKLAEELKTAEAAVIKAGEEKVKTGDDTPPEEGKSEDTSKTEDKTVHLGKEYEGLISKKGFKSPDDLAKAYQELEGRASRVENMAREALKKANEKQAEEEDDDQKEGIELLRGIIREELRGVTAPIMEDRNRKMVEDEIDRVKSVYPDFEGRLVDDSVRMVAEGKANSLEDAYRILTYDLVREKAGLISSKEESRAQKKQAYSEDAKGASGSRELDYENMTLEELEQVLPRVGSFIDHKGKLRR